MNRKSIFLIVTLLTLGLTAQVFATGTAAGVTITNTAYGGYDDANGNNIADVDDAGTRISDSVDIVVAQAYGVDIESDNSSDIDRNGTVTYALTVENTANGEDTIALTASTSGTSTWAEDIYLDNNGDGIINGADAIITNVTLAMDATANIIVEVSVTDGAQGEVGTTTVRATSEDGSTYDESTLASTVQAALITGSLVVDDASPAPGQTITYTLTFANSNNGNSAIAYSPVVTLPTPPSGFSWGGTVTRDGSSYTDPGEGGTVTFANIAADAANHTVTFTVTVNTDAANGATFTADVDIDYDDATGDAYTTVNKQASTATVSNTSGVSTTLSPASQSGDPGDVIVYKITVENTGDGDDSFTGSISTNDEGWTYTWYKDDGDGNWEGAGTETATNSTGTLVKTGTQVMWVVVTIPAGTADQTNDASVFRFTSGSDGTKTSDETADTDVTAPVLTLDKTYSVNGGGDPIPGATVTYTITISNSGTGAATDVVIKDTVPSEMTYSAGTLTVNGTGDPDADAVGNDSYYNSGSTLCYFWVGNMAARVDASTPTEIDVTFQATIK